MPLGGNLIPLTVNMAFTFVFLKNVSYFAQIGIWERFLTLPDSSTFLHYFFSNWY